MSGWTSVAASHIYSWPIGVLASASAVSLIFGAIGIWSLFRVRQLLRVVPAVEDRLNTLANSVSMLTDTTESCFKALAMQLQYDQAQRGRATPTAAPARSR